jgi:dipeptidyl aminopeptidase/acylaminoacyl peptidase
MRELLKPLYWAPPEGASGFLLFARQRTLMAQPVETANLTPSGEAFPVAENVGVGEVGAGNTLVSVSRKGILVYGADSPRLTNSYQLVWRDRSGQKTGTAGKPGVTDFMLSPDGKRVAVERRRDAGSDLWIADLEHGTESRLTSQADRAYTPAWSPDGNRLAYAYQTRNGIFVRTADGLGQEQQIASGAGKVRARAVVWDWTRDSKYVVVRASEGLLAVPFAGGKPVNLLPNGSEAQRAQVSPDGRFLAYTSDESGRQEVYVQPFAPSYEKPPSGKWQVSTNSGSSPRWSRDGKELFYMAFDGTILSSATRTSGATFEHDPPKLLFQSEVPQSEVESGGGFRFAVSADGQRFLVRELPPEANQQPPLTVVVNWLRR